MNKHNIVSLLSLIVILVIAVWVIYPNLNQIKDLNIKLGAKDKEISQAKQKINNLNTLKSEFNRFQEVVKQLEIAAPSEAQMPEILVQLETLAKRSGMEIISIQPTTTKNNQEVAVNLATNGNFASTLLFLRNLEKNARPIQVKSFTLDSAKAGEGNLSATFALGILKAK